MARRRVSYGIAAVLAVALVFRVEVVLATSSYRAHTDAADFDHLAVSLADTGHFPSSREWAPEGPTAFRPPGFPVALAGVYGLVGTGSASDRWEAGRIAEAALGTVAVGLICLIGLRLWGAAVGLVAGAIAAVYPPLVLVGTSLLSESLFIPLLLGAVWAALRQRDSAPRWGWAALSGLLLGLAALTRGNGVALAIPLVFLVWSARGGAGRFTRAALAAPAALLAVAVLVVAPWTIRNATVLHAFVPVTTETGYAVAGVYNAPTQHRRVLPALWYPPLRQMSALFRAEPHAGEARISAQLMSQGLGYVGRHPFSLLRTAWLSAGRLLNLEGPLLEELQSFGEGYPLALAKYSVYAFWVLLAVAAGGALTQRARRTAPALWACPAVLLLSTVLLEGGTRYRSPADPFLVMLAALAVVALGRRRSAGVDRSRSR